MRISILLLLSSLILHPACFGETVRALNFGSTEGAWWHGQYFEGMPCPAEVACRKNRGVSGTAEPALFESLIEGPLTLELAIPNGTYDATLFFAEPEHNPQPARTFDVLMQNELKIDSMDVMRYRDGQSRSALTVTLPDIVVQDEKLHMVLRPDSGDPLLSGLYLTSRNTEANTESDWELVWQELFEQPELDSAYWNVDEWPPGKVNNEDQAYTSEPKNLRVEAGKLVIEAHHHPQSAVAFTSARVHTLGKQDFRYGRLEVVAQLPGAQGTWPAIWLLPSDPFKYASNCVAGTDWQGNRQCDAWPNSGEIDMMEHVGFEPGHVHGTVHSRAYYWVTGNQRKGRLIKPSVTKGFHLYAMEWQPDRIDMYVDGTRYFSYLRSNKPSWQDWPFDQPFHLILNLAIGGDWGRAGGPIEREAFPQRMLVDSVRLYRRADLPANRD